MWSGANSLVQDLNSSLRVHFLRSYSSVCSSFPSHFCFFGFIDFFLLFVRVLYLLLFLALVISNSLLCLGVFLKRLNYLVSPRFNAFLFFLLFLWTYSPSTFFLNYTCTYSFVLWLSNTGLWAPLVSTLESYFCKFFFHQYELFSLKSKRQ